ncbi:MAG: hypothetical protein M1819_001672 [Sarea resinae]|nr:MAG: hypothetical protein M1819_001672 [Sarea resinae]
MAPKTWLITGTSSGIGLELALKALSRGDKVVATSRRPDGPALADLKSKGATIVQLDQNKSLEHVKAAVNEAIKAYGGIDILVANAAYVQTGMLEETTPEETLAQYQANVFGPVNVWRAILPHFRERRAGVIATVGSMAAWYPTPGSGLYGSSKSALRGLALGLQTETAQFGIKHCLIEPGFFRTELLDSTTNLGKSPAERRLPDYATLNETIDSAFSTWHHKQLGDPVKGAEVLYDLLTSSNVPPVLALGSDAVAQIKKSCEETIAQLKEWEKYSVLTDIPSGK